MTDTTPSPFWLLRETPLHAMTDAQWQVYYPAMVPWLQDTDAQIRDCAVERLMMAVFRAEFSAFPANESRAVTAKDRLVWLLDQIEQAHAIHSDVIPQFLRGLRYHGDDALFKTTLLTWLDTHLNSDLNGIDRGLIEGTRLLVENNNTAQSELTHFIVLLDHTSDYVRGCAAYILGNACDEDSTPDEETLFAIIGSKERERSGIAGAFWTSLQHDMDDATHQQVSEWMLDLYEQRNGLPPPLTVMPFNDIEFYLHELCCFSPNHMWRMLKGEHFELALMTATEVHDRVDGVEPILQSLSLNSNPRIALSAKAHLASHYGIEHVTQKL
jgi:hypothetical protein